MKLISQPALIPRVSISAVFVEATGVAHLHTRCPPASVLCDGISEQDLPLRFVEEQL